MYHRLVSSVSHLDRLYDMIKALPDSDGLFATDLASFRNRMCLREDGRCRIGIQTRALAMEGD